ncbi:MAG: ELM1/GtrOC1 family putative glycosyltransferase [Gammaproteobacteria bacterium]
MPRPRIALLVGGDSASYRFTPEIAVRLAKVASRSARQAGGALLVTTSRRTSEQAVQALYRELDCPHYFYRWRSGRDPDNPYPAFLALADRFIVTADSASLVAEACITGRPVELFNWPQRRRWRDLVPLHGRLLQWLVYWGLIKPRRNFDAFYRALLAEGWINPLGERGPPPKRPPDELQRTVDRVQRLMASRFGAMLPEDTRARASEGVS